MTGSKDLRCLIFDLANELVCLLKEGAKVHKKGDELLWNVPVLGDVVTGFENQKMGDSGRAVLEGLECLVDACRFLAGFRFAVFGVDLVIGMGFFSPLNVSIF